MKTTDVGRMEQWVWCRACDHSWHACTTPIELGTLVKLLQALVCPRCSADSKQLALLETGRTRPTR
jgi:hypothetical protein